MTSNALLRTSEKIAEWLAMTWCNPQQDWSNQSSRGDRKNWLKNRHWQYHSVHRKLTSPGMISSHSWPTSLCRHYFHMKEWKYRHTIPMLCCHPLCWTPIQPIPKPVDHISCFPVHIGVHIYMYDHTKSAPNSVSTPADHFNCSPVHAGVHIYLSNHTRSASNSVSTPATLSRDNDNLCIASRCKSESFNKDGGEAPTTKQLKESRLFTHRPR